MCAVFLDAVYFWGGRRRARRDASSDRNISENRLWRVRCVIHSRVRHRPAYWAPMGERIVGCAPPTQLSRAIIDRKRSYLRICAHAAIDTGCTHSVVLVPAIIAECVVWFGARCLEHSHMPAVTSSPTDMWPQRHSNDRRSHHRTHRPTFML